MPEGETLWATPSLPLAPTDDLPPDLLAGVDAIRLFCDRAVAQGPFRLSVENAGSVSRLCRRLDGIPLATELAAARTAALSPEHILDRLDRRFRLLTAGRRDIPRHETLAAAVEWSHDLLSDDERTLFRRQSVFRGFTLEGAEGVCAGDGINPSGVAALLADLVDRSRVVAGPQGEGLRYSLLDTLRVYAEERLREAGEEHDVRRRHLDWVTGLARGYNERQWSHVPSPDARAWESRSRIEHDNVPEALSWAVANDAEASGWCGISPCSGRQAVPLRRGAGGRPPRLPPEPTPRPTCGPRPAARRNPRQLPGRPCRRTPDARGGSGDISRPRREGGPRRHLARRALGR